MYDPEPTMPAHKDHATIIAMRRHGDVFVRELAELLTIAQWEDYVILKRAFKEMFEFYAESAKDEGISEKPTHTTMRWPHKERKKKL